MRQQGAVRPGSGGNPARGWAASLDGSRSCSPQACLVEAVVGLGIGLTMRMNPYPHSDRGKKNSSPPLMRGRAPMKNSGTETSRRMELDCGFRTLRYRTETRHRSQNLQSEASNALTSPPKKKKQIPIGPEDLEGGSKATRSSWSFAKSTLLARGRVGE